MCSEAFLQDFVVGRGGFGRALYLWKGFGAWVCALGCVLKVCFRFGVCLQGLVVRSDGFCRVMQDWHAPGAKGYGSVPFPGVCLVFLVCLPVFVVWCAGSS